EMGSLIRAYQIQLAHVGDPAEARTLLFGGMGYRPPFPADWHAAAEMVVGDEARYLAEADLYILTPQMSDVVVAAAQALTRKDLELVGEDDLPGMTGLVVLPHPVLVRGITGDVGDDRAYTWHCPSPIQGPAGRRRRRLRGGPAVRRSAFLESHRPLLPDFLLSFSAEGHSFGSAL